MNTHPILVINTTASSAFSVLGNTRCPDRKQGHRA
jgi:hypothetical protein